jgi:multidrug efflux pump subunit AcrA (membrane-fusion protein)
MKRAIVLTGLVAAALAGGCHRDAAVPSPVPASITRPLLQLNAAPGTWDTRPLVEIPQGALVERGGVSGVFVLSAGEARFRMVKVGRPVDGRVEILSGLRGDETLVTGDLNDVHDGTPVSGPAPAPRN